MSGLYKIFCVLFLIFLVGSAYFIEPFFEIKDLVKIILIPFLGWALPVFILRMVYPRCEMMLSIVLFTVIYFFISNEIDEFWFLQVFFVIYMVFIIYTLYVLKKKPIM